MKGVGEMENGNYLRDIETDNLLDKLDATVEPTPPEKLTKDWGGKTTRRQKIRCELNERGLILREST